MCLHILFLLDLIDLTLFTNIPKSEAFLGTPCVAEFEWEAGDGACVTLGVRECNLVLWRSVSDPYVVEMVL